jgi:hypothetical protein
MNANLKLWISTLLLLSISAATLIWQRSGIRAMRAELDSLRQTSLPQADRRGALRSVAEPGQPASQGPERPSLAEFLALLPDETGDIGSIYRALPTMLTPLSNCSSEQLLDLIAEMDERPAAGGSGGETLGMIRNLLMLLVAEDAPERILEMVEEEGDGSAAEMRAAAFAGLAQKDPDRARELLAGADWPAHQVQTAKCVLFGQLLKNDLPGALELFRDRQPDLLTSSRAMISDASSDPARREQLWAAARSEGDAAVREALVQGLIAGEFIRGGPQAMRKTCAESDFLDADLKASIVREFAASALPADPDQTYAWIRESLPAEQVPDALARAIASWAREDFNAAGTWLGNQEQSPSRDEAIGAFAKTVVEIDPAAAAAWAAAIEDEASRQKALDATLRRGRQQAPGAAETWADENGIELSEVPGGQPTTYQ